VSAFVVDASHIDLLVSAGLVFPERHCQNSKLRWQVPNTNPVERVELTYENADAIGVMLWAENYRSVDHRYPDDEEDLPGPDGFSGATTLTYVFDSIGGMLDPVVVLKALQCYEYQSCEHPEWKTSSARQFCEALRKVAIALLPGYSEAPWSFNDRAFFVKQAREAGLRDG